MCTTKSQVQGYLGLVRKVRQPLRKAHVPSAVVGRNPFDCMSRGHVHRASQRSLPPCVPDLTKPLPIFTGLKGAKKERPRYFIPVERAAGKPIIAPGCLSQELDLCLAS